jgi:hypothetical protein
LPQTGGRILRLAQIAALETPAKFIDFSIVPAETAEKQVTEEQKISEALRDRLVAIRED